MDEAKAAAMQRWIAASQLDVESAQRVLSWNPPRTVTAAYHLVQAVEKVLKAFLTCHGLPFSGSAGVPTLLRLAIPIAPALREWRGAARLLQHYHRPDPLALMDGGHPSRQAEEAVQHARSLYHLVSHLLSTDLARHNRMCPPTAT